MTVSAGGLVVGYKFKKMGKEYTTMQREVDVRWMSSSSVRVCVNEIVRMGGYRVKEWTKG